MTRTSLGLSKVILSVAGLLDKDGLPLSGYFTPDPAYVELIELAQRRLEEIQAWSLEEAQRRAYEWYTEAEQEYAKSAQHNADVIRECFAMLEELGDWQAPERMPGLEIKVAERLLDRINAHPAKAAPVCLTGAQYRWRKIREAEAALADAESDLRWATAQAYKRTAHATSLLVNLMIAG